MWLDLSEFQGLGLAMRARRKALFSAGAPEIWAKVLKGAARSSAFLALYCTLCWRGACVGFQTTGSCAPPVIAGSAWTGEPCAQNLYEEVISVGARQAHILGESERLALPAAIIPCGRSTRGFACILAAVA